MTQPSYVPIAEADQVRPSLRLEPPRVWVPDRPAELRLPVRPGGPRRGTPGPDQGYALRLARRVERSLVLQPGEAVHDVVVGVALLAARRAALFGRAPTIFDIQAVVALWGFLEAEPSEALVEERRAAFSGVGHDYPAQRALIDRVPEEVLRRRANEIAPGEWLS